VIVRSPRVAVAVAFSLSFLAATPALAQVQAGDILVPEFETGSVVNIRDGGDFTGVPRFATGLTEPMGLCQGPGGHIYVTENGSGEVTIITAGGNFTGAQAFATGLDTPASLLCTPTQILVTELLDGQVTDITAGGDFTTTPGFATTDTNPADLLRDGQGRLWVTTFDDGVIEITAGGDFRNATYYAPNNLDPDASLALTRIGPMLLVANELTDQVLNFTAGGNMSTLPVFATVNELIGMRYNAATDQLLAASEPDDAIYDISEGGDFTNGAPPFASGIVLFDVAHIVFVGAASQPECGNGTPETGEECDDGDEDDTDACPTTCENAECGDGFVRAMFEECDDGNEIDTDACPTTCENAECGDGFVQDLVEDCDDGNEVDTDACPTTCEAAECGDGFVQDLVEECDDGNTRPGDGCDETCAVEGGGGDDDGGDDAGDDTGDTGDTGDDTGDGGDDTGDGGDDSGGDGGDDTGGDDGTGADGGDGDGGGCSAAGRLGGGGLLAVLLALHGLFVAGASGRRVKVERFALLRKRRAVFWTCSRVTRAITRSTATSRSRSSP
jgi:cysteine-rich repeat protein